MAFGTNPLGVKMVYKSVPHELLEKGRVDQCLTVYQEAAVLLKEVVEPDVPARPAMATRLSENHGKGAMHDLEAAVGVTVMIALPSVDLFGMRKNKNISDRRRKLRRPRVWTLSLRALLRRRTVVLVQH